MHRTCKMLLSTRGFLLFACLTVQAVPPLSYWRDRNLGAGAAWKSLCGTDLVSPLDSFWFISSVWQLNVVTCPAPIEGLSPNLRLNCRQFKHGALCACAGKFAEIKVAARQCNRKAMLAHRRFKGGTCLRERIAFGVCYVPTTIQSI